MPLVGGISQEDREPDQEIHDLLNKVRHEIEGKLGKSFEKFIPESYRTQVVSGTNYFIKVCTDDKDTRLHVRIYQPFGGEPKFVTHLHKKPSEPLSYF